MLSVELQRKERKFKAICKWMTIGYIGIGIILAIVYASIGNWYLMGQSIGTIAALGAIFLVLKLLRIQPVYSLYAIIIGFTFAAYTLGVACAWYKTTAFYDKLLHTFSGTLTMMLALPLFYVVKSNHRVEKEDCALAVVFCVMSSLAVAGVWEIAEYLLSLFINTDPQCVQATGVVDTMQDMIVCTIGTALAVPSLIRYYRTGEGGLLYTPLEVFIQRNLKVCDA